MYHGGADNVREVHGGGHDDIVSYMNECGLTLTPPTLFFVLHVYILFIVVSAVCTWMFSRSGNLFRCVKQQRGPFVGHC